MLDNLEKKHKTEQPLSGTIKFTLKQVAPLKIFCFTFGLETVILFTFHSFKKY